MGWASGSRLAGRLIEAAKVDIKDEEDRRKFYDHMMDAFEDADCDTLDECLDIDLIFDQVWKRNNPDWGE